MSALDAAASAHDHDSIGDVGDCPTCSKLAVDLCASGPHGWLLLFPDTDQIAVVRDQAGDPAGTAWATGCNTGGAIGWTPIDPVIINAASVPMFTLLSGREREDALQRLHKAGAACTGRQS